MNRKYPIIHVGDKFNRWTAIEDEVIGDKYVLCRCSCGVTKRVKKDSLFSQKSKSCGCYNREISSQMAKLKQSLNKIEVVDDIAKVYLNETDYFIIDSDDVDMIKEYTWHRNNARGGYITANKRKHIDGNYGTIQVARYIMNCPKDMVVDHINGNVSDNRKDNLRICTHEQNSHNLVRTNGKSGHIGVYWDKTRENTKNARYQSYIAVDGKRVRKNFKVSDYGTKENAYEHACKWQEEMSIESYGEFSIYLSRDNLLLDKQQ